MKKFTLILFVVWMGMASSWAEEKKDWDALIEKAEKPVMDLIAGYRGALERERDAARERGDLDEVLNIEKEMKSVDGGGFPGTVFMPDGLGDLFFKAYPERAASVQKSLVNLAKIEKDSKYDKKLRFKINFWKNPWRGKEPLFLVRIPLRSGLDLPDAEPGDYRPNAKEYLEMCGITFPEGASAFHDKGKSIVVLRNTPTNIALAKAAIDRANNR